MLKLPKRRDREREVSICALKQAGRKTSRAKQRRWFTHILKTHAERRETGRERLVFALESKPVEKRRGFTHRLKSHAERRETGREGLVFAL